MTDGRLSVDCEELLNLEKERLREGGGELATVPSFLCLCLTERCIYLVTVFLPRRSITLLIDVHSVYVVLLPAKISLSAPSLCCLVCLSLSSFHSSSSSLNQTVTGGGAAFHANASPPLPSPVFSCAPSNRQSAKGLPMNFLLQGLIRYYLAVRDNMNFSSV